MYIRGTLASILRMAIYFAEEDIVLEDPTCKIHSRSCKSDQTLISIQIGFSVKLGILTVIEGGMLIIAACLVTIWPLFTQIMPRRFRGAFSRNQRNNHHRGWYQDKTPAQSQSQEAITRYPEEQSPEKAGGSSSPSLPCSLADLEDQRWSILVDERITSSHYETVGLNQK